MGCVSEFLVDYLDEDDELRPEVVKRLRYYTTALLDGTITPAAVAELGKGPEFKDADDFDQPLSEADRAYLVALEPLLDAYPEIRMGE